MYLEDFLELHAQAHPHRIAIICGEERITYSKLNSLVNERCTIYKDSKMRPIPLQSNRNVNFLVEYFAIHRSGNIAVPIEEGSVGTDLDFPNIKLPIDSADILYTTGTTGSPKGVVISHRAIMADAENLIRAQGYHENLTFIINGPLNHLGSLSKIYPTIVVGGTICLVDGIKNMDAFFQAIDLAKESVATFLVPASIRMLLTFAHKQLERHADKLEFIETGAAPISKNEMLRLKQLLPKCRLYNTYASTETGIVATYNFNDSVDCETGCVGYSLFHSDITITNDGFIACKGDTLMTGYLCNKEHSVSFIQENRIITNDIGHFDTQGRLFIDGRGDDIINVGGYKVAPTQVETAAMALPFIEDCICVASSHPILGTVLKLIVVPTKGLHVDKKELAIALRKSLVSYMLPAQYEFAESICRTFNGKLDRKAYR